MKNILPPIFTLAALLTASCGELPWNNEKATTPLPQGNVLPDMGTIEYINMRWPQNMVVLGDSIGTGLLGGTRMGDDVPTDYLKYLVNGVAGVSGQQLDLKGLGETEKPLHSPFTGSRIAGSLHSRLASITQNFSSLNAAIPGATSWEITQQIDAAVRNKQDFDFTVMEFGHNDFCNPNSNIDLFRSYYERQISRVLNINPRARILVVPLLNIPNLYKVAPDSATGTRLPFTFQMATANCKKMREEIENACPTFRVREPFFQDWANVVSQTAVAFQKVYPESRIVVANELNNADLITADKIALDCFHPNRAGYEAISAKLWESVKNSKIFSTLPR